MATKKMKESTRVNEVKHLGNVMVNSLDGIKKTSDAIEFTVGIVSKMMAILTTESEDDLEIARLWIAYEWELNRLMGKEQTATQLVLSLGSQVKEDGKKQTGNDTKKKG